MKSETYISSEDSRILRDALKDYSGERSLEIGTGNGGSLLELRENFDVVVGTDLSRPGMDDWKSAGVNFILADRASCMRPSVFDLVAFNPPYLKGRIDDETVDGGEDLEIPIGFLEHAMRVVKRTGTIVFLLNDDSDIGAIRAICGKSGFELERVVSRNVFFEELTVYAGRSKNRDRIQDQGEQGTPNGRSDNRPS